MWQWCCIRRYMVADPCAEAPNLNLHHSLDVWNEVVWIKSSARYGRTEPAVNLHTSSSSFPVCSNPTAFRVFYIVFKIIYLRTIRPGVLRRYRVRPPSPPPHCITRRSCTVQRGVETKFVSNNMRSRLVPFENEKPNFIKRIRIITMNTFRDNNVEYVTICVSRMTCSRTDT